MNKKPLKDCIENKFDNVELSDEQWKTMETLQADITASQPIPAIANRYPTRRTMLIASISALFVGGWLAGQMLNQGSIAQDIANEVTRHHFKDKPMEVVSSDYFDLRGYLEALPFQPIRSRQPELYGSTLLGGRYCSLKTEPAAQMRVIDQAGHKQTLYQAAYVPELFGEIPSAPPLTVESRGKQVHIWQESGLIFALTAESD